MQDSFFVRHSRSIAIISITGIVFCIVTLIAVPIAKHFSQKTYLTVQFAPASAHLELYNQGRSLTNGTYELPSGTYTGILTADGFQPKDVTITINAHQVNNYTDYLVNLSKGLSYFEQNASDIATIRSIQNDPDITSFLEAYDYKASIYDLLPLTISWLKYPNDAPMYNLTISNGINHPECTGTLCLATSGPKEDTIELANALAERGYNINDYEVFYEYSAI